MKKILIVDDSATQAARLRSILDDEYDVSVVQTAEEGLRRILEESFSLVLLDVVMPGMDGFTLLKKLQEEAATWDVPVIMITSLSDAEHEQRGRGLYHQTIQAADHQGESGYAYQAVRLPQTGGTAVHDRPADRDRQPAQV